MLYSIVMPSDANQVFGCILESHEGRILLVQGRKSGKWSFPKGHPLEDETPFECAQRELIEETGLCAPAYPTTIHQLATGVYYHYKVGEELIGEPEDTNEVIDLRWVSVDEMRHMSVNIDVNTYLRRTQSRRPSIPQKIQWRGIKVQS